MKPRVTDILLDLLMSVPLRTVAALLSTEDRIAFGFDKCFGWPGLLRREDKKGTPRTPLHNSRTYYIDRSPFGGMQLAGTFTLTLLRPPPPAGETLLDETQRTGKKRDFLFELAVDSTDSFGSDRGTTPSATENHEMECRPL